MNVTRAVRGVSAMKDHRITRPWYRAEAALSGLLHADTRFISDRTDSGWTGYPSLFSALKSLVRDEKKARVKTEEQSKI